MSAVEKETPPALSEQEKQAILQGLGLVRDLPGVLMQDNVTLKEVMGCLSARQQKLEELFGRSLKGPQQQEERSCRLALETFTNEQMSFDDLKPLREKALIEKSSKAAASTPKPKRGLGQRLFER